MNNPRGTIYINNKKHVIEHERCEIRPLVTSALANPIDSTHIFGILEPYVEKNVYIISSLPEGATLKIKERPNEYVTAFLKLPGSITQYAVGTFSSVLVRGLIENKLLLCYAQARNSTCKLSPSKDIKNATNGNTR